MGAPVAQWVNGWWIYVVGPVAGAAIAVRFIALVRGRSNKEEREAAEGGALPIGR
jgi:TRAP-type C4-dicarboxylate transport system permease small subunit